MTDVKIARMEEQISTLQKQRSEMVEEIKSIRSVLVVQSLLFMAQIVGFFLALTNS